jgi:prepilin-type N-terminal cleavage/methylation domain-containing protein
MLAIITGRPRKNLLSQSGFTVLELMVATTIFAIVLLVLTVGVLSFSRDYFSSVTRSNTQTVGRNIIDDITRTIQFSSAGLTENDTGNTHAWCFDNVQYLAAAGYEVGASFDATTHKSKYGLIKRVSAGCGGVDITSATYAFNSATDKELLSKNMRISLLSIAKPGDVYNIQVRIAYGDDDVFASIADMTKLACKSQAGSQFCAVSDLSTTVQQRIE